MAEAAKTALVTGAGSGIGRGCAEVLAGCGANIAVNDVDAASAEQTAASLRAAGRPVEVVTELGTEHGHLNRPHEPAASVTIDRFAARLAALADEVCGGRLVACHEGGYSQGYAPVCTWAAVEGLSGVRTGHVDPYDAWLGGIPEATEVGPAGAAIDRAVEVHGARWGLR